MIGRQQDDGGFVLVDALVAVALVASAGTVIYLLGLGMLQQVDRRLDRSVALVNLKGFASEVALLGWSGATLVREDDLYAYIIRETPVELPGGKVHAVTVEATPRRRGAPVSLSFLSAARNS